MPPKANSPRKRTGKLLPDRIAKVLGDPAITAFEDARDFKALHSELVVEYEPEGFQEHALVWDITNCQWQAMRLREMMSTVVELKIPNAAITLLGAEYVLKTGEPWARAEGSLLRSTRRAVHGVDNDLRLLENVAERAGVSLRMLKTEAFTRALPSVSAIWDLIAKAEHRRDQAIQKLIIRRQSQAAARALIDQEKGDKVVDVANVTLEQKS